MASPLVSVASVRVSLIVRTKQAIEAGASRRWSETLTGRLYGDRGPGTLGSRRPRSIVREIDCTRDGVRYNRRLVITPGSSPSLQSRPSRP